MLEYPLVSIGMPIYNRTVSLRKALESIINQNYKNIEVIISDNCSPNAEVERIIKNFMEKDPRIKYFKQEKNIGAANNFKFVFEKSNGEYFMWASDDDLWKNEFIEEGINFLLNNPNYQAWFSTIENIDTFDHVIRKYSSFERFSSTKYRFIDVVKFVSEAEILGKANIIYSVYKKKSLEKIVNNMYFINEKWGSDNCFNLAFLTQHNIYCSDRVLIQKRIERETDNMESINPIIIDSPQFHIFPFSKSIEYIKENFKATKSTQYWPIVCVVLLIRVLISFRNFLLTRFNNIRKIINA